MKKLKNLMFVTATAMVVLGFQSCNKVFTTAQLKGTWNLSSTDESGESKQTYVNDTDNFGEVLSRSTSYTEKFSGTGVSGERTTESIYDAEGGGLVLTKTIDVETTTPTQDKTTRTYFYSNDSTFLDTLNFEDNFTREMTKKYTFEKDGTFTAVFTSKDAGSIVDEDTSYVDTYTYSDEETTNISGTWAYLGENKSDEIKNNQRVGLWYTNAVSTSKGTESNKTVDLDSEDSFDYTEAEVIETSTNNSENEFADSTPSEVWLLNSKSKDEITVQFENNINNSSSTDTYSDSSNPGIVSTYVSNSTSSSVGNSTFTKE